MESLSKPCFENPNLHHYTEYDGYLMSSFYHGKAVQVEHIRLTLG